ncbi:outer membrane protein assembly factor BamE [Pseudaestuariivita atlantica]|uniref:SmpA/OmlA n=1 Tax=Pseudaestuariivita atlantica TaxID=1317121 RepID=A0A0L1JUY2_9RHOB|nr:outer membrane protein assembly factor BamE [Pseudaestuariivita atlantica]KNG95487.1 SmpA/OmlA [Pseudaestuariivita atlantica]
MPGTTQTLRIAVAALALVALSACTAQFRNHGYIPLEEDLSQIVVGIDTRDTVADIVGEPSTAGVLNESGFYYVRSRVRTFAYRRPEVVEREVLAISFDEAGVVTNIERFGLENGQVVPLARRVTKSNTADIGFIRRLLRNLGNFNAGDLLGAR